MTVTIVAVVALNYLNKYLHFSMSFSVITLPISFVLYSLINSNAAFFEGNLIIDQIQRKLTYRSTKPLIVYNTTSIVCILLELKLFKIDGQIFEI